MSKLRLELAIFLCAMSLAPLAYADIQFGSVGIQTAESANNVSGTHQNALSLRYQVISQSSKFWLPSSLDLTVGALESGTDTGSFVSFGPSYRFGLGKRKSGKWFVDFGIHPTYLGKNVYSGRPIGGNFHFTSYLGLGTFLGQQRKTSILLRYQHTSNAGIKNPNPGLDMVGLTFSYHFGINDRLLSAKNNSKE
jgi:hypothetical protein